MNVEVLSSVVKDEISLVSIIDTEDEVLEILDDVDEEEEFAVDKGETLELPDVDTKLESSDGNTEETELELVEDAKELVTALVETIEE